jgi:hypothetical protein
MNRKHLQGLFNYLNQVCFKGKLKKTKLQYSPIVKRDRAGDAIAFFEWAGNKALRIKLDPRATYTPLHYVLLHEMVHQYDHQMGRRDKKVIHNTAFKKRLKRLHKKLGWKMPPAWSMKG